MQLSCFYFNALLKLPGCQVGTHAAGHAIGSIWATDVPGWITALATFGLLIGAIITARYAIKAFGKQTEQLEDQRTVNAKQTDVLELQATELRESLDERRREAELRHRDQAARVFISETRHDPRVGVPATLYLPSGAPIKSPAVRTYVKNASDLPIYDAEFRWHRGSEGYGDPNPEPLGTLMPGEEATKIREFPVGTNLEASGATLRFRDAAGAIWMRRPDGGLTEQQ